PRVLRGVIGGKMKSDLRRKTNRHLAEPFPEDPVLMSRSTCRSLALGLALLCFFGAVAFAQSPDCGILQGNASTMLPNFAGSLPPSGDNTTGQGSSHLYVLTQWGFARAPVSSPANP